jgi:hypothetical protein
MKAKASSARHDDVPPGLIIYTHIAVEKTSKEEMWQSQRSTLPGPPTNV